MLRRHVVEDHAPLRLQLWEKQRLGDAVGRRAPLGRVGEGDLDDLAPFRRELPRILGGRHELLEGIRILKYYSWEAAFEALVVGKRAKEIIVLTRMAYVVAVGFSLVLLSFSREHDDEWWSTFYAIEVVTPQTQN